MTSPNKVPNFSREDTEETASNSTNMTIQEETAWDDAGLIEKAEAEVSQEKYLNASRLLKQVTNKNILQAKHYQIMHWADIAETGMKDLLLPAEREGSLWEKQAESHGHRDFFVYYHVNERNELTSRIDSVIESSLFIPMVAVFNESDLYETWMPSFKKPFKLGIGKTKMLKESGRGNQIIQVVVNMAWPLKTREVVQHAVAMDVIDEEGTIIVQVLSESHDDDPAIPPPLPGVVRVDLDICMVFRGCPPDHPCLAKSRHEYPEGEELISISLTQKADPHLKLVPRGLINFVTRTVIGRFWASLLHVAEDVRDGKRPRHQEAIAAKRELYDWIEARIDIMVDKVKQESSLRKSQELDIKI